MSIADINIALHLKTIQEQNRQAKRNQERKKQQDKDLNKLAKEFLTLKKKGLI